MGIGLCENSVVVEEPPRIPVSNQHLCPEFALQSVGVELSHSASDSHPISVENEVGVMLTSERLSTNDSRLNGESVEEENHIDTGEYDIGNGGKSLKKGRSEGEDGRLKAVRVADLACGVCLKESDNVDDAMEEKAQGLSEEIGMFGKVGNGKLNADCESSWEVTPTVGLGGESSLKENGSVDDVCLEESSMLGKDDDGKLNGYCDLSKDVTSMVDLDGDGCLNVTCNAINDCGVGRSLEGLHDSRLSGEEETVSPHLPVEKLANGDTNHLIEECDLPLEDLPMVSMASSDCLEESNTADIDACAAEIAGDCLQESKAPVLDEDANLLANSSVECLDERNGNADPFSGDKPVEFLLQSPKHYEGDDGYQTGDHISPPEVVSVAVLASGGSLDEIHNGTEGYSMEIAGECLQDSKLQGEDVARLLMGDHDLPLEAIAMDAVADGRCLNELQTGIDTCDIKGGNKCSQDIRLDDNEGLGNLIEDCESLLTIIPMVSVAGGDSNESYTSSSSKGEGGLENIKEERDSPPKAVPVYCIHQDEQKDAKTFGCFPADDINEEMENNYDGVPDIYSDLCIQEPSLQDCEILKLVPLDGVLCNKDNVVGGFDSAIGHGNFATSVASEADTFTEISPLLQPCEMKLEASHSNEEVSNCVQNTEENAGSGCPLNEMIMEAAGVERRIVRDSMGEENNVVSDVKVEVENPSNERFVLQPGHPLGGSDDDSSKSSNLLHENSFLDSIKTSSGHADNQGNSEYGMNCLSEILPPSSQRNARRSESNRKIQTRKATRNSRKTAKASSPLGGIEVVFEPRKKRSMFRPPRSSAWGLLDIVMRLFVNQNGLDDVIPASNKRSCKPKLDKKNEKKNKNGVTARSRDSKKKCPTSITKLRLKVKMGKGIDQSLENATAPELVYTSTIQTAISGANGTELCTRSPQVADREESLQSYFVSRNQGGTAFFLGASVQDSQPIKESEINLVNEKLVEDLKDDYFGVSSDVIKALRLTESRCRDPGTSPDSEVINTVPDVLTDSRHDDGLHRTLTSPEDLLPPGDLTSNKKGKKKGKSPQAIRKHKDTSLKHHGRQQNCNNGTCAGEDLDATAFADASINSISDDDPSLGSKETTTAKTKGQKLPRGKSQHSDSGKVKARSKGEIPQRSVGTEKINKSEDQVTSTVECQPGAEDHLADDMGKINTSDCIQSKFDLLPGAVNEQYHPISDAWVSCDACRKWRCIPTRLADLINESQCTWTCMENTDKAFADCSIPQEKSNAEINAELEISDASGEEDAFGNRSSNKGLQLVQPRERPNTVTCASIRTNQFLHRNRKTNNIDEIMVCHCKPHPDGRLGCGDDCLNRMLNIECAPGACPCGELCSNQQFQKRKYAKLEKFPCGKKGFGLKLMEDIPKGKFLIEYVGEVLDMQVYEARQKEYARKGHKHFYFMTLNGIEVIDACVKGNKGRFINHSCDPNCRTEKWMVNGEICIGLFAMRDMKKGEEVTFDYNYVRVFGAAAKKCHCMAQQCRGYIGGDPLSGDVIIQSDSEDEYPKPVRRARCRPGVKDDLVCRADSLSTTVKQTVESAVQNGVERNEPPLTRVQSEAKDENIHHSGSPIYDVLDSEEKVSPFAGRSELSQQSEDVARELISTVVPGSFVREETPVKELSKSSSDGVCTDSKSSADNFDDRKLSSKARSKVKTSRSPGSIKTPKVENRAPNASKVQLTGNKSQALPLKPKKLMEGPLRNRFEAVEEKLNELLDTDGGLSRRKDSAKGYLKLLLLTSASGDSEAIQRNRDLSMILDALLKTRSRAVLTDIINKNGLRMLHKIMKQYRGDFKKIPILRKLLKVLEYLAYREILTAEHIREDPPRPGMESFRESILSLTEHDDRQVHQIARNFRDKWIPKHLRRNCFSDWDDKSEFSRSSKSSRYSPTRNNGSDYFGRHSSEATRSDHHGRSSEATRSDLYSRRPSEATGSDHRYPGNRSEATDLVKRSTSLALSVNPGTEDGVSSSCASVPRIRKRKSRWDQQAETTTDPGSFQIKEQKVEHKQIEPPSSNKNHAGSGSQLENPDTAQLTQEDELEDFPPGFSPPIKPCPAKCPSDIATGYPQEKFISRLPVTYGIPLSIVQRFGVPLGEAEATEESWSVAPGMPFLPFPPLPTIPRDKACNRLPSGEASHSSVGQLAGEVNGSMMDCNHRPSTTGDQPAVLVEEGEDGSNPCKRGRESSQDLGTRYFKQQKWNHTKLRPPWHWSKNGSVFVGSDSGGETNGDVTNDVSSASTSTHQQQDHNQTQIDT